MGLGGVPHMVLLPYNVNDVSHKTLIFIQLLVGPPSLQHRVEKRANFLSPHHTTSYYPLTNKKKKKEIIKSMEKKRERKKTLSSFFDRRPIIKKKISEKNSVRTRGIDSKKRLSL